MMTKKEALKEFKMYTMPYVRNRYEFNGIDKVARREAWSDFIDELERRKVITPAQAFKWSNPF